MIGRSVLFLLLCCLGLLCGSTKVLAGPLSNWSNYTPANFTPLAAAYLDGRFIVGSYGAINFSADGVNWESQELDREYNPSHIDFDGEAFVAVASRNTICRIYRSVDGRHWERVFEFVESTAFAGLAHGNGWFVALTTNGGVVRSSDHGRTWTKTTPLANTYPASGGPANSLAFGSGVFVMIVIPSSSGALVFNSTDGATWINRTSGLGLPWDAVLKRVEYLNGAFYIARNSNGGIHRSTNGGVTWQAAVFSGVIPETITGLAAGPDSLVAGIRESWTGEYCVVTSQDGLTWGNRTPTQLNEFLVPNYADGRFVSCYDYKLRFSDSYYPANQVPTVTITGPATCNAREIVVFDATTSDGDGDPLTLLWDFGDGTSFEKTASCSHSFTAGGARTVKLYATDKRGAVTVGTHTVTVSDPLITWTPRNSGTTAKLNAVACGNGTLVAVGSPAGAYRVSNDGINWTGGEIGGNVTLTDVIHDGTQFVATGYDLDGDWTGAIYTSPEGLTWTRRYFSGGRLQGVAWGAGRYVAVGDAGSVVDSPDGISWTAETSNTTRDLFGVAYGQQAFVAVGGGSRTVITSPDGITWTNTSGAAGSTTWPTATSGIVFSTVAYSGDRFLLSGPNAQLRYSLNAGASFLENGTNRWEITGFAYGNGLHFACGYDRQNSSADANLVSVDGWTWTPLPTEAQENRNDTVFFNGSFFTVGDNGSIRQSIVTGPPLFGGYEGWQTSHFPEAPPHSGPDDDYDQDGMPNLGEYVTGTDPRDPSDRVEIVGTVTDGYFILTVPKVQDTGDVSTVVEFSSDLTLWGQDGITIVENSATRLVAKVTIGSGAGFVRPVFRQGGG